MKVIIAGGTGFIGRHLIERLTQAGYQCRVLSRSPAPNSALIPWDGKTQGAWVDELRDAGAVVNLAGANIGRGRWTTRRKQTLVDSRLASTQALTQALEHIDNDDHAGGPRVFINASAVGYYGDRGDQRLTEEAPAGEGFLADLCQQWEHAARQAANIPRTREVRMRFGVILAPDSEALQRMVLPFRLFVGGPMGHGQQWLPWVHIDDVTGLIQLAIENRELDGAVNTCAPEPVRWATFARHLGNALHRPSWLPAPAFALRLGLGEMADEMLLASQRVLAEKAVKVGYEFNYTGVEEALKASLTSIQRH